jgi:protein-S-isoprenylcysteine O-methyltransferase
VTRFILQVMVILFPVSEIILAFWKRSHRRSAHREDRGSMRLLWLSILLGIPIAMLAQGVHAARIPGPSWVLLSGASLLLAGGLALRWTAIVTLGRYFTVDVAVHSDHVVVQHGPYRFMRHPSYTGLLVAFLGIGLSFGNWLSLLLLFLPIVPAVIYRVAREEWTLLRFLGPEYADYCARTKRFVPGLF